MEEQQVKVIIFYSLWIVFGIFVFLPLYFSGSRILMVFCLISFFLFLSVAYRLRQYKNNMKSFKVGKDHYVRLLFVVPLLITPSIENLGEYYKEQATYKALIKIRQVKLTKKEKEALAFKIEGLDIGIKIFALPSRLISNTVSWFLSPVTNNLDEDSYCSRLMVKKLEKNVEEEMLAKIKRSEISIKAREIDDSGGIKSFMDSISTEALYKLVNQSFFEGMMKDLGHSLNLVFGTHTCQMMLLD